MQPFFTILTPTYNRLHTLVRPLESLVLQTFKDFEWLVIDDGSTDGTEGWFRAIEGLYDFPIRYYKCQHRGKHISINRGTILAKGILTGVLDSDDELTSDALDRINYNWLRLGTMSKRICGIGGLTYGAELFPATPYDAYPSDVIFKYKGERWGVTRTDLMRQYPLPDVAGDFVPEGLQDLQMSGKYKRRYVNEVFRVYHDSEDSLTKNKNNSKPGLLYYYKWIWRHMWRYAPKAPLKFAKAAVMIPWLILSS